MENSVPLQTFIEALANSGCSDNQKLKEASEFIETSKDKPGFCQAMMQISSNAEFREGIEFDINLAAAIQLKNIVQYHWKYNNLEDVKKFDDEDSDDEEVKSIIIPQADKDFVKQHIIQACAVAPSFAVLKLLEETVYVVARYEMPGNWPNAMNEISELLNEENESKVFGGLVALKEVVHKFEFEFKENRVPLQEIADNLFPRIEQIFLSLLEDNSDIAMKAKNIIIETLHLANNARILNRYQDADNFDTLVNVICKGFTQTIPEEYTKYTEDVNEIERMRKSDFWKFKITTIKCLNRLFIQLADPEMVDEENEALGHHFRGKHAKDILDIAFLVLEVYMTNYVSNEVVSFACRIISKTERIPELREFVFLRQEDVIFKYSIPLLKITPEEIEEFTDNPVSYVRMQFSIADTINSAKSSGIDLMNYFVTYKDSDGDDIDSPYVEKFLNYISETLEQNHDDFKVKESALTALCYLCETLTRSKSFKSEIENLMKNHAFPELSGDNEILKAKALWLYGQLISFVKDPKHATEAVGHVYKALLDECLPVKVFAGTTLHKLCKIKDAKEIIAPGITDIIQAYLYVMQEIDQDELVNALEEMVHHFDDKVEPFAFELIQQLASRFKKIVKTQEESMGEGILTANACVCAIRRIISAVSKNKELMGRIEEEVYPIILFSMTPKGLDYVEDALDCSILIVYHKQSISEKMWKIFYHMLKIIIGDASKEVDEVDGGYGFEFFTIMVSYFQNCISFGGDNFLQMEHEGETPFKILIRSLGRILEIERHQEGIYASSVCVMKIIGTILESSFGKIDDALPDFIGLLHSELSNEPKSKIYRSSILQTFSMCFVYNTNLTYNVLADLGLTEYMLKFFFSNMGTFRQTYEIRRVLYGISSIIASDPTNAPDLLKGEIQAIMNIVVILIDGYVKAKQSEMHNEVSEASKYQTLQDQGFEEEDEFKKILSKLRDIKQKEGKLIDIAIDEEDDEDDEEYEIGDELIFTAGDLELYDSPLEKVDAPIYFRNVMEELEKNNQELYNSLISMLSEEQNQQLIKNFAKNEELMKLEKEF